MITCCDVVVVVVATVSDFSSGVSHMLPLSPPWCSGAVVFVSMDEAMVSFCSSHHLCKYPKQRVIRLNNMAADAIFSLELADTDREEHHHGLTTLAGSVHEELRPWL